MTSLRCRVNGSESAGLSHYAPRPGFCGNRYVLIARGDHYCSPYLSTIDPGAAGSTTRRHTGEEPQEHGNLGAPGAADLGAEEVRRRPASPVRPPGHPEPVCRGWAWGWERDARACPPSKAPLRGRLQTHQHPDPRLAPERRAGTGGHPMGKLRFPQLSLDPVEIFIRHVGSFGSQVDGMFVA